MSVQAITWALEFRVRSATEKAILLVLANYANEYGISWPSQPTVAEQAACNERTVRRTLLEFETRGILKRFPRWRRNGSRQLAAREVANAQLHVHALKFGERAKTDPPFPSDPHYDAKAWEFCDRMRGAGTVLFWNVAPLAQP